MKIWNSTEIVFGEQKRFDQENIEKLIFREMAGNKLYMFQA